MFIYSCRCVLLFFFVLNLVTECCVPHRLQLFLILSAFRFFFGFATTQRKYLYVSYFYFLFILLHTHLYSIWVSDVCVCVCCCCSRSMVCAWGCYARSLYRSLLSLPLRYKSCLFTCAILFVIFCSTLFSSFWPCLGRVRISTHSSSRWNAI